MAQGSLRIGKMKKSKVYFTPIDDSKDINELKSAFGKIITQSGLLNNVGEGEFTAIKLHFGEEDTDGYVNPRAIKVLVDAIKKKNAKPFLTDTNVLYKGMRSNAVDHLNLAYSHGFGYETTGAPLIIADGIFGENEKSFSVKGHHLTSIKTAAPIQYFDNMISVAHCTGHMNTGYAGALKNICMGFASRAGKQIQHTSTKPTINGDKCVLCKRCMDLCPENAIIEKNGKAFIDKKKCTGCSECIIACFKHFAVNISWSEGIRLSQEKMVEYALGILSQIKNKVFFNFAVHVTSDCDCMPKSEVIADNIGILASADPVALDKASHDLILAKMGKDGFKDRYPEADCKRMFEYAGQMGLGNMEYILQKI